MAADAEYHYSQGRIDRLEVENFKSYRGHQHIGPFKAFTAVIGPNGSGKSNLMDAISFVLGVKTTQLRGSLKELLYSDGGATQAEPPRRGFVKLVYVLKEPSPQGGSAERELHFTRAILPTGSGADPEGAGGGFRSEYRIDGRAVSWEAYAARLGSLGILVKVRNFLVFQGDIEAVASKSPAGLTALFEQISGSEALKGRFEALQAARAAAEEKVSLLFTKRKQVLVELKAKKREKEEADKHTRGLEELRGYRSDLAVWQLAVAGRGLREALADQRQAEEALAALQHKSGGSEGRVEALRRLAAGHKKEAAGVEKRMKKLQAERDKKSPALLKAKEALGRLTRDVRAARKAAGDKGAAAAAQEAKLAALRAELEKVDKEEAALQREVDKHYKAHSKSGVGLDSGAMQAEYTRLKIQVGSETSRQATERKALEAEQAADAEVLSQLTARAEQLRGRAAQLRAQAAEAAGKREATAAKLEEDRRSLAEKQKQRQKVQDDRTRSNAQRSGLLQQQERLQGELDGLRMDRSQSRREREAAEMAEKLKQIFPGRVYGKLVTLAKPVQKQYDLALAVALQRDLDSVVVDDERTAKECIEVLREERKPPMNFLPLSFIKVKPLSERLRGLGPHARLAVDLLDMGDRRVERAFHYALGDTVIVDGEAEARRLAFAEGLKVVSLEGTLITKKGAMTGGTAPDSSRGARWDEGQLTRLKQELREVTEKLESLPSGRQLADAEQALAAELSSLGTQIKYAEAEIKEGGRKGAEQEAQAARAEADAGRQEPAIAAARERMEAREAEIERLTAAINAATDRIMADFSRRAGVGSVREWEEAHAAFEARVAERRRELESRRTKSQSQLDYETGRTQQLRREAEAAETEAAEAEARRPALEAEVERAQAAAAAAEGEASALAAQLEELRDKASTVEAQVGELQAAAAEFGKRAAELRRAAAAAGAAVEERAGRMLDLVNTARVEQIRIPRKRRRGGAEGAEEDEEEADAEAGGSGDEAGGDGSDDDEEEEDGGDGDGDAKMKERGARRRRRRGGAAKVRHGDVIDLDELVAGVAGAEGGGGGAADADGGGGGPSATQTASLAAAMSGLVDAMDVSRLTKQQLAADTKREREKAEAELRGRIGALSEALEKEAPNMRAGEQYEAVRAREREQLAALQVAQSEAAAATSEFNNVRGQRHTLFTTAFKHISEQISSIYKALTCSATHPLGGQAYLHLEDEEEPYAGGIKYTAIPPAKRFRDMEQLSGGEKTVAALALLFAIHSFRPSPFFVLDEVDAALDATNVARVAHFIRARTRPRAGGRGGGGAGGAEGAEADEEEEADGEGEGGEGPHGFQSIVISLKDIFYEKADSLVGVCRDLDAACSKTFTFDLSRFEEPLPDA
ncbi:hypothetical protein HYH03_012263 [Edaphochlamys debaryana]|uniref:Structural maintenance of chromosomes protein n=1 Tax=Edaphochlamys debaryana TaxID=47281 RepID=A0A835XS73_9CHLO|nr:hypothetical protein HYH03_012263 [Edaphochlamys debaryana]|eukprot:KAG2489243.1 hypothetical protein HYH03_012263 [Edaphochlamys debaryana]